MDKIKVLQSIYRELHDIQYLSNQQLFHYYRKVSHVLTFRSSLFISVKSHIKTKDVLITKYFTFNVLHDVQFQKRQHVFLLTRSLNIPIRELECHFCRSNSKKQLILVNTAFLLHIIYSDIQFLKQRHVDELHEEKHSNKLSKTFYQQLNGYLISPIDRHQFCISYNKALAPLVGSYRHILEARIFHYYKLIGKHIFKYHRDRLIIFRAKRILRQNHGSYLLGALCYGSLSPNQPIHHVKFSQMFQLKLNLCSYLINNARFSPNFEINRAKFLIENHKSFWYISKRTGVDRHLLQAINKNTKRFHDLTVRDVDNLSKYYMSTHQDHVLNKNNHTKKAK